MILIAQDMFEIWGFNREALKIEKKTTKKKFQMLFEQNIASNVTRNQESKHITNLNILKEPPSMPMGPQACPSTQNNYLEYKSRRNFIKVLLQSIKYFKCKAVLLSDNHTEF